MIVHSGADERDSMYVPAPVAPGSGRDPTRTDRTRCRVRDGQRQVDGGRRIDRGTVHAAMMLEKSAGREGQAAPRSTLDLPKWQQRTVFGLLSNGFHP